MSFLQKIKRGISNIDMFYSTEMLRYNKDTQYQTVTGGIVTIGIIVMVITGFFSMISETINRTAIGSTINVIKSNDPPAFNLTTNAQNMFMFGLQITSTDYAFFYNMSAERRYFDVLVQQYTIKYGQLTNQTVLPMVPCTDQHWAMLPNLVANKDMLLYQTWLCPPIDSQYNLQGSFFSNIFSQIVIKVLPCTNASIPERPCHPQQDIDNLFTTYGNFYFAVNYINAVINPSQTNYLSYYIQPMDYIIFSATQGAELFYFFTDYTIESDNSIWPFTSTKVDRGVLIEDRSPSRTLSVNDYTGYAQIALAKSTNSIQYNRIVQKISAVFSYIGGLVGAISAVLFLIKAYTDTSLEVSVAMSLFNQPKRKKDEGDQKELQNGDGNVQQLEKEEAKQEPRTKKRFNIIGFIKLNLYKLFRNFRFAENWTQARAFDEFREEIVNHLDIKILLRRLINLQSCVSCIFDEYQLDCLKHQKKFDIEKVRKLRKMLFEQQEDEQVELSMGIPSQNIIYRFEDPKKEDNQKPRDSYLTPSQRDPNEALSEHIQNSGMQIVKPNPHSATGTDELVKDFNRTDSKTKWITKKTMKSFKLLNKSKDQNFISKKIWENANDQIKKHLANVEEQDKSINISEIIKKRSFIKPTLPTIVIRAEP